MAKQKESLYKQLNALNKDLTKQNKKNISVLTLKKYFSRYEKDLRRIKIMYGLKIYNACLTDRYFSLIMIRELKTKKAMKRKR